MSSPRLSLFAERVAPPADLDTRHPGILWVKSEVQQRGDCSEPVDEHNGSRLRRSNSAAAPQATRESTPGATSARTQEATGRWPARDNQGPQENSGRRRGGDAPQDSP